MNCKYITHNGRCGLKGSHAYKHFCYTQDCCKCWEPSTNFDVIKSMDIEELASFLASVENRRSVSGGAQRNGATHVLNWLNQSETIND